MSSMSSLNSLLSSGSANTTGINLGSLLAAATGATSVGIDVTSAVDAAIYAARGPERQWQAEQSSIQSQSAAISAIGSALSTLSADLNTLNDPLGATSAKTVESSSASLVTATASPNAATGTHLVSVQSLATSSSWYSSALASATASLGSSNFVITLGDGTQKSFGLGGSGLNSLTDLANTIKSASMGLSASVVTDATGSRLALVSQQTGAAAKFSVADTSSTSPTWTSASLTNAAASVGASTLQIGDGTATKSLTVTSGTSLSAVASQINGLGLGLSANVVSDSSGAHLSVASTNGQSVTLSSDPTLLLTQSSIGSDASLKVDGVPVTSSSNTVTGAIAGVTLNLQGATSGSPVSLNVAADTSQITSVLSQFVTDYNSAVSMVSSQFSYNSSAKSQGVLGSDPTVRSLQSTLLGITGYVSTSGGASLATFGLSVGNDGTLSLDTAKLNGALASNPASVQAFLQGSALNGFANAAQQQLQVFSAPGSGVLAANLNNLAQRYSALQSNVTDFESGYIASQQTVLTTMYSNAEIALQQLPTKLKQIQSEFGNGTGN